MRGCQVAWACGGRGNSQLWLEAGAPVLQLSGLRPDRRAGPTASARSASRCVSFCVFLELALLPRPRVWPGPGGGPGSPAHHFEDEVFGGSFNFLVLL